MYVKENGNDTCYNFYTEFSLLAFHYLYSLLWYSNGLKGVAIFEGGGGGGRLSITLLPSRVTVTSPTHTKHNPIKVCISVCLLVMIMLFHNQQNTF
jgi:hypothetical protein